MAQALVMEEAGSALREGIHWELMPGEGGLDLTLGGLEGKCARCALTARFNGPGHPEEKRDFLLRTEWESAGPGLLRVDHSLRTRKTMLLASFGVRWDLSELLEEVSYRFVPHLHPEAGQVVADQVFRSPALILGGEGLSVALVPDLGALDTLQRQGLRAAMTLEGRTLSYAVTAHHVEGHVYFRERAFPGFLLLAGEEVRLAYFLLLSREGGRALHRMANTLLWERFGRPRLERHAERERGLQELAALATRWFFLDDENWEWLSDEGGCGGVYTFNVHSRRPPVRTGPLTGRLLIRFPSIYPAILRFGAAHVVNRRAGLRLLRWQIRRFSATMPRCIQMQSWFNLARTSYAGRWMALETGDQEWLRKSEAALELVLRAPAPEGIPHAILFLLGKRQVWVKGSRGFHYWDWYHLPDAATTGFHLLEWYRDFLPRPEVMDACRSLGEALIRCQLPSGAFPAWLRFEGGEPRPHPDLMESASTAAPVMFLAFLARLSGEVRYLEAAERGAGFLVREVMPCDLWQDYETFFSCSTKPIGWSDPRTGCHPENTMCMIWAARAFLELFLATGNAEHLERGRTVLDRLLSYQQVWSPPVMSIDLFGGFGVQNTDAEWNDARQGLAAPLLADYFLANGEEELLVRAIAALRACFSTMYLGEEPYPLMRPSALGAIEENYAHSGFDGTTAGYIHNDWGPGTAVYALSRIFQSCGQVLVDDEGRSAYAVDRFDIRRCVIGGGRVELLLSGMGGWEPQEVLLRFIRVQGDRELVLNETLRGRFSQSDLEKGVRLPLQAPGPDRGFRVGEGRIE
ncbi:hypothetical protein [Candidatus Solincola tengchongensis]|uniref:hypothetical protein n=1 Tax=Candidatus Solincola tengchongensis TaxID=2900693 RepID=UPI002579CCA3|nr:hypothetical protein [Candidatus Solincola tengchongensis]